MRFGECDGLGHVNNTTYFTYMEHARMDVFRLFNPTLSVAQWNLIAASTRCDFLQQATYAQPLTVYTWIGRIGNRSFDVEHAIQAEDGTWVARGQATLVTFDYQRNQSRPLTDAEKQALQQHLGGPQEAPALHAR
ncbi:acyl-CoA thioesterase [Alicyclobacillus shizuokensis]|uniref:acyl-CoA thioesterase n=1 Tax=Alicyclobacillus shizuokensis TaxID=392014 RepID=UPI000ABD0F1B|nr:acyl-CoA thioesterase [Alicyclobacillus shizuokensis]